MARRATLPLIPIDVHCLAPFDPNNELLEPLVLRRLQHFRAWESKSDSLHHSDVSSPHTFHHQLRSHQLTVAEMEPTYVRCCNPACGRYTRTLRDTDPCIFPRIWTCSKAEPNM